MFFKFRYILIIALLSSCIKEGRKECRCRAIMDLSYVMKASHLPLLLSVEGRDGYLFQDTISKVNYDENYYIYVPKGKIRVNAISCEDGFFTYNKGVVIDKGNQCPQLYSYSSILNSRKEEIREKIITRKNFCLLNIKLKGDENIDYKPFSVEVVGNVGGYDLNGEPFQSEFFVEIDPNMNNKLSVSLPRQIDNSLVLNIKDKSGIVRTFALGQYIVECGYDWNRNDLEDIDIELDYVYNTFSLKSKVWDEEFNYNIEI